MAVSLGHLLYLYHLHETGCNVHDTVYIKYTLNSFENYKYYIVIVKYVTYHYTFQFCSFVLWIYGCHGGSHESTVFSIAAVIIP